MSILIRGLDMPTDGRLFAVIIDSTSGEVMRPREDGVYAVADGAKAVPVPPHGRLIEESKVLDIIYEWCPDDDGSVSKDGDLREMLDEIESLPTIIDAEEGE